nr:hypothetical protein Iba_chr03dCG1120 [Ipomoea batatas]
MPLIRLFDPTNISDDTYRSPEVYEIKLMLISWHRYSLTRSYRHASLHQLPYEPCSAQLSSRLMHKPTVLLSSHACAPECCAAPEASSLFALCGSCRTPSPSHSWPCKIASSSQSYRVGKPLSFADESSPRPLPASALRRSRSRALQQAGSLDPLLLALSFSAVR